MPRLIDAPGTDAAELGEIVEALEVDGFDPRDEDAFAAFGLTLKRLANNRQFLAQVIAEQLADRCAGQESSNGYGAQVIMLHAGRSFAVRANIWPDADHSLFRANGKRAFFYEVPHDHNMSFLTVGYAGPGYWSDYYEYDYGAVEGHAGERVELRHVERSCLSPGKVQLYRAHRDVHSQLPPERLSISLNVMEVSPATAFRDQYIFDIDQRSIAAIANPLPHESLFTAAAMLGEDRALEIVDDIARSHPSARVRFAALLALASAAPTIEGRLGQLERGAGDRDRVIRTLTRRRLASVEAAREMNNNNNAMYSNNEVMDVTLQ